MQLTSFEYTVSHIISGVAIAAVMIMVCDRAYDGPQITAQLDRLQELESRAEVYDTMIEMNVGVWCGLAVHYDWLDEDDKGKIAGIISSGVHNE